MKSVLLTLAAASVANAYYYTVDVMANTQDKWLTCVNANTYDFKGTDLSTGKPWDGIGGTCNFNDDPYPFSYHNADWRLNQFYNVTVQSGSSPSDVISLTTIEGGGIVIPCFQVDEYHETKDDPNIANDREFPFGFKNHWLFACYSKRIFRNVDPSTTTTTTTTTAKPTTSMPAVSTTTTTTTTKATTTATTTKTTTNTPTPTCIAGYKGKLNGQGPNGACCSSSDDCKETCVKGVCKLYT